MLKTVIVICGPTAVGKTAFAVEVARILNTSIISADLRQCFKELNIGVAKPSPEELNAVPHFFIGTNSVNDTVSAGIFEQYAVQVTEKIFSTNDIVLIVGGTGLYINAFCNGLDNIPEINPAIRSIIIENYNKNGLRYLQNELSCYDQQFWQQAEQQNPQRLMRALEVTLSTGKSILEFQQRRKKERPFNIIKVGLHLPKAELYERINSRVDLMMQQGLLEEVKSLLQYKHLNALQTVGYKELFDYLDDKKELQQAVTDIKTNTRHYAKRQLTWFKKDPDLKWFNTNEIKSKDMIEMLQTQF